MSSRTTIAVCYKAGTQDILRIWLYSVSDFSRNLPNIFIVTADEQSTLEAHDCCTEWLPKANVVQVSLGEVPTTRIHGAMLDQFLSGNLVDTEFFMTMDSDCFPVADGWLEGLEKMMDDGAKVAGILHPWAPPPSDMDQNKIEWRVRSQHCWDSTHVACQMIRPEDLKELGVTYSGGDDTGLLIPLNAKRLGWKIDGYKVSRCAKPFDKSDPEFNRYVCLIFGDKVYHHGGYTRIATQGDKPVMEDAYNWVKIELMRNREAEFLLMDEHSYQFKFDREEEVAREKMDRLFGSLTTGKL
jgi:hypothetical protein